MHAITRSDISKGSEIDLVNHYEISLRQLIIADDFSCLRIARDRYPKKHFVTYFLNSPIDFEHCSFDKELKAHFYQGYHLESDGILLDQLGKHFQSLKELVDFLNNTLHKEIFRYPKH